MAYLPASVAEEPEFVLMKAEDRIAVAHADASDTGIRQRCIQRPLGHEVDGASGFVQEEVARLDQKSPCDRDALLFAERQYAWPVLRGVEAAVTRGEVGKADPLEQALQLHVCSGPAADARIVQLFA